MKPHKLSLLSKTVLISGIIIFILLMIGLLTFFYLFSFALDNPLNHESEITIIAYSTMTSTSATLIDKVLQTPSPNTNNSFFAKGLKVIVQGTGGEGLRIHQQAGQDSPTIYLANDGELYVVTDGPIIASGYVWWQIKSLATESILGWAAQDFLQLKIN